MSQNGTNESKGLKQDPSKRQPRRLVVLFDGTGNARQSMTNVSRMFEAIDDSFPEFYKPIDVSGDCPPSEFQGPAYTKTFPCETCNQSKIMDPAEHEGDDSKANLRAGVPCGSCNQLVVEPELQRVQRVKYIPGVGTGRFKGVIAWLTAQTCGYGLSDKIKDGYKWLCDNYEDKDEVFVFGFSRGAFAARSLVSMLYYCYGVLPKKGKDKKAIKTAYKYYRSTSSRAPGPVYVESTGEEDEVKQRLVQRSRREVFIEHLLKHKIKTEPLHVQVKMLGVWDTVGALGLPINTGFSFINDCWPNRGHYKFHDQNLSCIVDNAYHALALDEQREAFKPTLWTSRTSEDQEVKGEVKQVWFVGSHCNVGGGADLDDILDPDDLWQYSYVWMQRHAEKHGLRFFWNYESPATRQANSQTRTRRVPLRKTEPSLKNFLHGFYKGWKWVTSGVPFVRETDPALAMLHWSVLERINITKADLDLAKENDLETLMTVVYQPEALSGKKVGNDGNVLFRLFGSAWRWWRGHHLKGSPEVTGAVLAAKWHIETDDVTAYTEWPLQEKGKGKETEEKKVA